MYKSFLIKLGNIQDHDGLTLLWTAIRRRLFLPGSISCSKNMVCRSATGSAAITAVNEHSAY